MPFSGLSIFTCPTSELPYARQAHQPLSSLYYLENLIQKANDLIRAAKAPSTRKAYQSDFRIFESWCAAHGLASLPAAPETIALYIASCAVARLAPATIARRLASISKAHQAAGFENSPASTKHFVVGEVLKGARRTLGVAQKCKDPLLLNDICHLLAACPQNLLGSARSRPNPDWIRGSVSPLGTLCDDRV
jgi:hypothetical protein